VALDRGDYARDGLFTMYKQKKSGTCIMYIVESHNHTRRPLKSRTRHYCIVPFYFWIAAVALSYYIMSHFKPVFKLLNQSFACPTHLRCAVYDELRVLQTKDIDMI